ncbi:hypothetical protein EI94DRAFT_1744547 [Lactarius quietus]|nr:hypothetical protein EI94DRAFT_1744547 [Lactarius quietus]
MDVDISLPKQAFLIKSCNASINHSHVTHTNKHTILLDPDSEDSSDVQSFDEEDMYGLDNSDDIIAVWMDSEDDVQEYSEDLTHTALEAASDQQQSLIGIFDDVIRKIDDLRAEIGNASAMDIAVHETQAEYQGRTFEIISEMESA